MESGGIVSLGVSRDLVEMFELGEMVLWADRPPRVPFILWRGRVGVVLIGIPILVYFGVIIWYILPQIISEPSLVLSCH